MDTQIYAINQQLAEEKNQNREKDIMLNKLEQKLQAFDSQFEIYHNKFAEIQHSKKLAEIKQQQKQEKKAQIELIQQQNHLELEQYSIKMKKLQDENRKL